MIRLTPKPPQRICSSVFISDYDTYGNSKQAITSALTQAATDMIRNVTDRYTTHERDERMHGTKYRIDAVVMSQEEYEENLRQAYLSGAHAGKRS